MNISSATKATALAATLLMSAVPFAAQAQVAVSRDKFGLSKEFYIPKVNTVTQIPFDIVRFQEKSNVSLTADGMFLVNVPGLYYVQLGLDWKDQENTDRNTRMYGLRRKAVGDTTPPNLQDERLASFNHPGSDAPRVARYTGTWSPGTVALGGYASLEVTVAPSNTAKIGDLAQASLTSLTDQNLGVAANTAIQLQARVVAANRVRVTLYNPSVAAGITVPAGGTLNVVAMSSTLKMGESADAWNVLNTPMTWLNAGDKVYVIGKNIGVANDYVQPSVGSTFVQFEYFGN